MPLSPFNVGALGLVGLTIGFVLGNSENEKVKGNAFTFVAAMFGGGGLIGLIGWLQSQDNRAALLVAMGALGTFLGMLVGIYLREKGFTLSSDGNGDG